MPHTSSAGYVDGVLGSATAHCCLVGFVDLYAARGRRATAINPAHSVVVSIEGPDVATGDRLRKCRLALIGIVPSGTSAVVGDGRRLNRDDRGAGDRVVERVRPVGPGRNVVDIASD